MCRSNKIEERVLEEIFYLKNVFETIFKISRLKRPEYAAVYYLLYILKFKTFGQMKYKGSRGCSFTEIHKTAQEERLIRGGKRTDESSLRTGRNELLRGGILAQIVWAEKAKFKAEAFIPINPMVLVKKYFDQLEDRFGKDVLQKSRLKELVDIYLDKFGSTLEECKNITVLHFTEWNTNMALGFLEFTDCKEILIRVSGNKLLTNQYVDSLYRILEKAKLRILLSKEAVMSHKNALDNLKAKFNDSISVRYFGVDTYSTTRLFVIPQKVGIDGRKVLSAGGGYYISTIYSDRDAVDKLTRRFEALWEISESVY